MLRRRLRILSRAATVFCHDGGVREPQLLVEFRRGVKIECLHLDRIWCLLYPRNLHIDKIGGGEE